jgi:hypothetical protein
VLNMYLISTIPSLGCHSNMVSFDHVKILCLCRMMRISELQIFSGVGHLSGGSYNSW